MLETRFHRFLCSHPKNLISDLFKQQVYCIIQRDAVPDMFGLVIFLCIIIHQCAGLRRWTIKPFWDQTVRVCFSCFPRKITGRSDFVPTCKNCSHSISLTLRLDLLFSIIRRLKKIYCLYCKYNCLQMLGAFSSKDVQLMQNKKKILTSITSKKESLSLGLNACWGLDAFCQSLYRHFPTPLYSGFNSVSNQQAPSAAR